MCALGKVPAAFCTHRNTAARLASKVTVKLQCNVYCDRNIILPKENNNHDARTRTPSGGGEWSRAVRQTVFTTCARYLRPPVRTSRTVSSGFLASAPLPGLLRYPHQRQKPASVNGPLRLGECVCLHQFRSAGIRQVLTTLCRHPLSVITSLIPEYTICLCVSYLSSLLGFRITKH